MQKIAIITGGAQGLGKKISNYLFNKSYKIIIIDKSHRASLDNKYIQRIEKYYQVDLSNTENLIKIIDSVLNNYQNIDILVNNAALRIFNRFDKFSIEDVKKYYNVNIISAIILINKVYPIMEAQNKGHIINISSVSGFNGYSSGSLYCSTKGALIKYTESVSKELKGTDITINVICPDSFQLKDGTKLKSYSYIINKIYNIFDNIINGKNSKTVLIVMPFMKRILHFLSRIKMIFM